MRGEVGNPPGETSFLEGDPQVGGGVSGREDQRCPVIGWDSLQSSAAAVPSKAGPHLCLVEYNFCNYSELRNSFLCLLYFLRSV